MVSSISGNAGAGAMQQMMAAMQTKMKAANTDGKEGLSRTELNSLKNGDDKASAQIASELAKNFDKIDKDKDGQATEEEIKAARPQKPMGPPPGMMMQGPPPSGKAETTSGTTESSSSQIYDELDTNEDGEVSFQERLAGQLAEQTSSLNSSSDSSETESNNGVSTYISKLLSNYQKDSSESTSSFELAA